jgi:hypothetical protein
MLETSAGLREVFWTYSDRHGPLPLHTQHFPWSRLNRFETQNTVTLAEFIHILQQSSNITHGTFTITDSEFLTSSPIPLPVIHEKISDLDLLIDAEPLIHLFECLTLPALQSVSILAPDEFEFWPHFNFLTFLSRLRTPLRRLRLSGTSIESGELVDILRAIPTLTNLYIEGFASTFLGNDFFHALTLRADDQEGSIHICPRLETLTLRATIASSEGVLADMVESRYNLDMQGFAKLRRVDLTVTWDWVGTCDYWRLDELNRKGLVFFVPAYEGETAWDKDEYRALLQSDEREHSGTFS